MKTSPRPRTPRSPNCWPRPFHRPNPSECEPPQHLNLSLRFAHSLPLPEFREAPLSADAASLYDKLEHIVIPLFYRDPDRFTGVMHHSISLNGSFFNTQRMLSQYVIKAYFE